MSDRLKQNTNDFVNGINKDYAGIGSPERVIDFVLNAVRDSFTGDKYFYQSEPGNEAWARNIPGFIMGSIYGSDGQTYIFSTDGTTSYIGVVQTPDYDSYTNIITSTCLGFQECHPITGEYRIKNGCDRHLYFQDGINPDRAINLDNLDQYLDSSDELDCDLIKFTPNLAIPCINTPQVNDSGGALELGNYYFQVDLLDSSLSVMSRSYISPPTAIYDESSATVYRQLDGGFNFPAYSADIGGVPTTSKSITLTIDNVDTRASFVQINVVRAITGDGFTVDAHSVGNLIPANNSTVIFTYSGFNPSAGDALLDVSSLVVPGVSYEISGGHTQVQNRLVRFNVKEGSYRWEEFQQAVSLITSSYVTDEIDPNDITQLGDPKNPNTWWDRMSFLGDEVHAMGVVFVFNNGTETPAFHIPGNCAVTTADQVIQGNNNDHPRISFIGSDPNEWHTFLMEVIPTGITNGLNVNVDEVRHLGFNATNLLSTSNDPLDIGYGPGLVPRWKIWNTAIANGDGTGTMAYYECNTSVYVNPKPDCINDYWGVDACGNQLEGTPIRHHRFPDRILEPQFNNGKVRLLGIEFDNITYPHPDIVGHYFVRAKRDELNKTVLDTGIVFPMRERLGISSPVFGVNGFWGEDSSMANDLLFFPISPSVTPQNYALATPTTVTQDAVLNGTHIVVNGVYSTTNLVTGFQSEGFSEITFNSAQYDYTNNPLTQINYNIDREIYFPANTTSTDTYDFTQYERIVNPSVANDWNYLFLGSDLDALSNRQIYNVSVKAEKDVYCNLDAITYYRMHSCLLTLDSDDPIYGGDVFISDFTLIDYGTTINTTDPVSVEETVIMTSEIISNIFVESTINYALVHTGSDCNTRYRGSLIDSDGILNYLETQVIADTEQDTVVINICPQFYGYNRDYSRLQCDSVYFAVSTGFNFCSDCIGEFKNRLVWSPVSRDSDLADSYLTNLANDFIDIPAHRGPITGVEYQNNQLLVHTDQTTFLLQPNPQTIQTDQNTLYIGTGDFLSIPPYELIQTDVGYAGNQGRFNDVKSQFGYTWVDQKRGQIFNWTGKNFDEISNKGLTQWFKENLPSKLNQQFKSLTGQDYPCIDATTDCGSGMGLIAVFDPRFKRYILHKKDYEIINPSTFGGINDGTSFQGGILYYNNDTRTWWYGDPAQDIVNVDLNDEQWFRNRSWTISYSYEYGSWTSWHSYMPNYMFFDEDNFYSYSCCQPDVLYWHFHRYGYQEYFSNKYPFIVDWINNDYQTDDLHTVHWIGDPLEWDYQAEKWKVREDRTFNQMICYNQDESSGLLTLQYIDQVTNPYGNIVLPETTKSVIRTDDDYKVSGIRDLATNDPINSCAWDQVQSYFGVEDSCNGYIDHVPINIDPNKLWTQLKHINGKYSHTRLIFNPSDDADIKQVINIALVNEFNSVS